jgi:hypothetical protein
MFAAGLSGLAEIKEYTRRTVDTMTGDERCAHQSEEPRILGAKWLIFLSHNAVTLGGAQPRHPGA